MKPRFLKAAGLAVLVVLLLWLSQITRFENHVRVVVTPERLFAEHEGAQLDVPFSLERIDRVTGRFQRTMLGYGGVVGLSIKTGSEPAPPGKPSFWLWGRDWLQNISTGTIERFVPSFNDWTSEKSFSTQVPLAGALPNSFEMEFTVLGRGESWVTFHAGEKTLGVALNDGLIDNAFAICDSSGCPGSASPVESISTNLRRMTNTLCELALPAVILMLILYLLGNRLTFAARMDANRRIFLTGVVFVTAVHFAACMYFASYILGSVPHVSDSAVYYRQALAMAQGALQSIPLPAQPFEAFRSNGGHIVNDRLVHLHATHFWPALIAIFIRLGVPALLGPILSTLGVLSLILITRQMVGRTAALLAGAFLSLSPFAIIQAGDYMMHTCTMSFLLMSLACLLRGARTARSGWFAAAGALWGYAFGVRQLTVLGLSIPLLVLLLPLLRRASNRRALAAFTIGGIPLAALFMLDSWWITGSPLKSPHVFLWGLSASLSNLQFGLSQMDSCLAALAPISFYSPFPYLFGALVWLGLALNRDKASLLAAASMAGLLAAYSLLNTNGMHGYGPRFLFEALPAACFLAGRGALSLLSIPKLLPRLVVGGGLAGLFVANILGLATILPQYQHYNALFTDLHEKIAALPPRESLVIVPNYGWQDMDVAATLYDPSFEGLIVIKELPDGSHQQIIDRFRDRRVCRMIGRTVVEVPRGS